MRIAKIQPNNQLLNIPDKYNGWGNFRNASTELQESFGFYEVVYPTITDSENYGKPFFDEVNKVITFEIIPKPILQPFFNFQECRQKIAEHFRNKMYDSRFQLYTFFENVQMQEWKIVKNGLQFWLSQSLITQNDYDTVKGIISEYGINLDNI